MSQTPPRPQWKVRLDRYHQFVVQRLEGAWETDRSEALERMVVQWVIDHPAIVEQVGATLKDWQKERDTGGTKPSP